MIALKGATQTASLPHAATEANDKSAWQAALSGAANKPNSPTSVYNAGNNLVMSTNDRGAATIADKFGDKNGPQGTVFLDRHTNTATLTALDPKTNGMWPAMTVLKDGISEPETITFAKDRAGHVYVKNGTIRAEWVPYDGVTAAHFEVSFGHNGDDKVAVADSINGLNSAGHSMGLAAIVTTPNPRPRLGDDLLFLNEPNSATRTADTGTSRVFSTYFPARGNGRDYMSPPAPRSPHWWDRVGHVLKSIVLWRD